MARRGQLQFAAFERQLRDRALDIARLRKLIELDPAAARPQLRFRAGVLADAPPPDYDLDAAIWQWQRRRQLLRDRETAASPARRKVGSRELLQRRSLVARPRVVAEGDSWFNLPCIIRPVAVADRLQSNGRVELDNLAHWGDTLARILERKQYLAALAGAPAAWLILSAGGNDLQEALADGRLLLHVTQAPAGGPWLSAAGLAVLAEIGAGYRTLFDEVLREHPGLRVLCYAYDYPRPEVGEGVYIGRFLRALGYAPRLWPHIMRTLMAALAEQIRIASQPFDTVEFLDCFGVAQSLPWFDDLHPNSRGFSALAQRFEARLLAAAGAAAVSPRRGASQNRRGARRTAVPSSGSRRASASRPRESAKRSR